MNRREFLKNAALVTAGNILPENLFADEYQFRRISTEPYSIKVTPLIVTDKNYYDTQKYVSELKQMGDIPNVARLGTAAEELAIIRYYEKNGIDPRTEREYKDYFSGKRRSFLIGSFRWWWTSTGIRVPKGWDPEDKDTMTGKYPRIILAADKEVGDIQIPKGRASAVREINETFGIPTEVAQGIGHYAKHDLHFWFNPSTRLDKISGHYDVAIGVGAVWKGDSHDGCFVILTDKRTKSPADAFRLVHHVY